MIFTVYTCIQGEYVPKAEFIITANYIDTVEERNMGRMAVMPFQKFKQATVADFSRKSAAVS